MILRELLISIGVDFTDKGLKKAETALGTFKKAALAIGGAIASGFVVHQVATLIDETTKAADAAEEMAASFGLSVESLQKLSYAAELGGASADSMRTALSRMSRTAVDAARGNKEARATFKHLGIAVTDANGHVRGSEELFRDAADAIAKIQNPTERTAAAIDLFGRDGARLIPLLSKGSKGFDEYGDRLEKLGGVISTDFAKKSSDFQDDLTDWDMAMGGLKRTIVGAILPAATLLVEKGTKLVSFFRTVLEGSRAVEAAFLVLGAAAIALGIKMLIPWLPVIGMVLLVGAALTALILIVDDVWVALEGGESITGDVIKWFEKLIDTVTSFGSSGNKAIDFFIVRPLQAVLLLVREVMAQFEAAKAAFSGDFGPLKQLASRYASAFPTQAIRDLVVGDLNSSTPYSSLFGAEGGGPSFTPPSGSRSYTNAPQFNMEIEVNGSPGMDPNALAVEVGRHVEARLQTHYENAVAASGVGLE